MVKSLPALPYTSAITTAHPWEVSYGALKEKVAMYSG
jgi:hypothetical protein